METVTKSPWKRLATLLSLDKAEVTQLYLYAIFGGIISLSLPLGDRKSTRLNSSHSS